MILEVDPYMEDPDEQRQQELLEEEYWTQHEILEAKQLAYDLGDMMLGAGFSHEDAEAKVSRYLGQVGSGTFTAYSNRLAATVARTIPKGE